MEPHNLKKWKVELPSGCIGYFYTCARPGRSLGPDEPIPDSLVSEWVRGLPPGDEKIIISLLGRKKDRRRLSEFSHYTFCGAWDTEKERVDKLTLQDWLDEHHRNMKIMVLEHPTYDYDSPPIHHGALLAVEKDILSLLLEDRTIIVMDSGGIGRTGKVVEFLGASEVPVPC